MKVLGQNIQAVNIPMDTALFTSMLCVDEQTDGVGRF